VSNDGVAFMKGLKSAGVLSVVKHFPGLGGASSNTDYGPAATLPFSVLQRGALLPFANAIANGAQAIMLSNASTPGLSPLPASISPTTISYLRQTMGFNGLIVTDSLSAGAISARHLSESQAAVLAIEAGADLVLCGSPTSPPASLALATKVSTALQAAVTSGVVPLATLQAAAAQVLWAQAQVGAS
jgi:beta-N-acetylhexosaminidase